jgi:uncharacterized protein
MISETEILSRIKRTVLDREPSAKIYLYGSRARGDARRDSDWDLLILLNRDRVSHELENQIRTPLYDVELEVGEVFSAIFYPEKEWNKKHSVTPFYENVMREGKRL